MRYALRLLVALVLLAGPACDKSGIKDSGGGAAEPAKTEPAKAADKKTADEPAKKAEPAKKGKAADKKDAADAKPAVPMLETPKHLAGPPATASKSKTGLAWVILDEGKGESGAAGDDEVQWHYRSWDPKGTLLFDTYEKGAPKDMKVRRMLAGYREAVSTMKVGERRRVWMPAKLARKKRKRRKAVGPEGNRIVDIHLVGWAKAPPPPADLKKPPKSAKKLPSGLVMAVLKKGEGQLSPTEKDRVEVKYAGWRQKTGECFDFTGPDDTSNFGAGTVIKGWVEGLANMVEGDKVRLWIPAELAYKGKPSKPQGTLVFDVELLKIIQP